VDAWRPLLRGLLLAVVLLVRFTAAAADEDLIPRPPELERDVRFWVRVYTEVTTSAGFLHDEHDLGIVYQVVQFDPDATPAQRREVIEDLRERYRAILRRLSEAEGERSEEEQRVAALFGTQVTPARLEQAAAGIRFQLGQANRFREGLERAGIWGGHIADTFARRGLPPEIAALPHVESSFNPAAYSKVGAAGLWQFMRSTGRRFLRINDAVDERLDPFRATEAAAQLLDYNYRLLGSWPLAITAYNHGAAGMRRARDALGTSDIATIVREHHSPTFGFASRNFYVSFLAALEIDRDPARYFGPIERRGTVRYPEVEVPADVPVAVLLRATQVERASLQALNPALLPAVWKGKRRVPAGYLLRLPESARDWTKERLAAAL
jgi:membrane-bound lytic murein transglycosylase D